MLPRLQVTLVRDAQQAGYAIVVRVVLIPEDLAVARVASRVGFHRLWDQLHAAIEVVDQARVYDNSSASRPFRRIASYRHGFLIGEPSWPAWTPQKLSTAGR